MSDSDMDDPVLAESRRVLREYEALEAAAEARRRSQAVVYDEGEYVSESYTSSEEDDGWVEPNQLATQPNFNSRSMVPAARIFTDENGNYFQYFEDTHTYQPLYNWPPQPSPQQPIYQPAPSRQAQTYPQPHQHAYQQPHAQQKKYTHPTQHNPQRVSGQVQPQHVQPPPQPRRAFNPPPQAGAAPAQRPTQQPQPAEQVPLPLPGRPRQQVQAQPFQQVTPAPSTKFKLVGPPKPSQQPPQARLPVQSSAQQTSQPQPKPPAAPGQAKFHFYKPPSQAQVVPQQSAAASSGTSGGPLAGPSRVAPTRAPIQSNSRSGSAGAFQPAPPHRGANVFRPAGGLTAKAGGAVPSGSSAAPQKKAGPDEVDFDAIGEGDDAFYAQIGDQMDDYGAAAQGDPALAGLTQPGVHGSGKMVLKPTSCLPDVFRSVFSFRLFNRIQSDTFDVAFAPKEDNKPEKRKDNLVVSAPTGAGKTVIFELAILAELRDSPSSKVIYVCPTRSLCNERVADWKRKFPPVGMNVIEYTGEAVSKNKSDKAEIADLANARLIVTTPEKMDQLTRRDDNHRHIKNVGLVCLDEVHSVSSDVRGPVLEVLVSRLKKITQARFVCVSATIPNSADVARWIGNRYDPHGSARLFNFGEETRPCPLERFVVGVPRASSTNDFAFTSTLNFKLYDLISKHSDGKPALVFVNTRKACQQAADQIRKQYAEALSAAKPQPVPWAQPETNFDAEDKGLSNLLKYGIGIHHAGLGFHDRRLVEQNFTDSTLSVVVCTTTLAVGVNLPARLVIVRGTNSWNNGRAMPYSELDMLQMIGRAGRPQFDNKGVGVILCSKEDESHYDSLVHSKTLLESKLHRSLVEHLNSEITLHTINNMDEAVDWIGGTFLSVRFAKNKFYYRQIAEEGGQNGADMPPEATLETFISKACGALSEAGVIHEDKDGRLFSTSLGEIMSRWGISFASFKQICALPRGASMRQVLECVAGSEEASQIRWRGGERPAFKKMNNSLLYPVRTLNTSQDKVMILLQAALGGFPLAELKVDASNPTMELMTLWPVVVRTAKAIVDLQADRQDGGIKNGLELIRSLQGRAWEGTAIVLRQIKGIGEKASKILEDAGVNSIDAFVKSDYHRVQTLIQPGITQAKRMLNEAKGFPKFGLRVTIDREEAIEGEGVRVLGTIEVWLENATTVKIDKEARYHCSLLTLRSDNDFIDFRRMPIKAIKKDGVQKIVLRTTLTKPSNTIVAIAACDEVAGTAAQARVAPRTSGDDWPEVVFKDDKADDVEMGEGGFELDADGEAELMAMEQAATGDKSGGGGPTGRPAPKMSFPKPVPPSRGAAPVGANAGTSSNANPTTSTARASGTFSSTLPPRLAGLPVSDDEYPDPVQRPDGRWACNHKCKGVCKHKCCNEGLDKPPKPKPKAKALPVDATTPAPPAPQPSPPRSVPVARAPAQTVQVAHRVPVASTLRPVARAGPAMVMSDDDEEVLPDPSTLLAPEAVAKARKRALEARRAKMKLPKLPKPTLADTQSCKSFEDLERIVRVRPALIGKLPQNYQDELVRRLGLDRIPHTSSEEEEVEVEDDDPWARQLANMPEPFSSDDEVQVQEPRPAGGSHLAAVMGPARPSAKAGAGTTSRVLQSSSSGVGVKRGRSPGKGLELDSLYDSDEGGAEGEQEGPPAKVVRVGAEAAKPVEKSGVRGLPPRLPHTPLFPLDGEGEEVDELDDDVLVEAPQPVPLVSSTMVSSQPVPSGSRPALDQAMNVDQPAEAKTKETDNSWLGTIGQPDADGNIDWSWLDAQTETDEQEQMRLAQEARDRAERVLRMEAERGWRREEEERARGREERAERAEEKARRAARELEEELKGAGAGKGKGKEEEEVVVDDDPLAELNRWLKESGMVEEE